MDSRWLPVIPVVFCLSGVGIGLIIMGCQSAPRAEKRATTSTESLGVPQPAAPAALGERLLDTSTPAAPSFAAAPVTTSRFAKARRKPGSDENLPSWVPLRGRLTVVEAPDLAENLGLVPKGTTKSTSERVSVADALAKRAYVGTTTTTASGAQANSATWLTANGHFRRSRR